MGQTPIYDQLCDEHLNANISARHSDLDGATHQDKLPKGPTSSAARCGVIPAIRDRSRGLPPSVIVDLSPTSASADNLDTGHPAERAAAMPAEKHARTTPRHPGHLSVAGHPPVTPTTAGAGEHEAVGQAGRTKRPNR